MGMAAAAVRRELVAEHLPDDGRSLAAAFLAGFRADRSASALRRKPRQLSAISASILLK
jgi:hypothetical protein